MRAKLTLDEVQQIRTRRLAGEGSYVLAREFGVSPCQIWRICNRVCWPRTPGPSFTPAQVRTARQIVEELK